MFIKQKIKINLFIKKKIYIYINYVINLCILIFKINELLMIIWLGGISKNLDMKMTGKIWK